MKIKTPFTWNGKLIKTSYVYPPIPIREFDWAAYFDDDCGCEECHALVSRGSSESIAITDLLQQMLNN